MTDAHTPADGPEEPAEPPDGRAGPSMPPDPFAPADTAHALVVATLHGLRRNGAGLVEACLTTAAWVVLNGTVSEAKQPPEQTLCTTSG